MQQIITSVTLHDWGKKALWMYVEMCDLSVSHNSQRKREELDLRGNSDRSPFCRDTCWESWLRGSGAERQLARKARQAQDLMDLKA